MNERDLRYFEDLIRGKRERILRDLEHFQEVAMSGTMTELAGDLSDYPDYPSDRGSDATAREAAFQCAARERRYLYHLDQALERMGKGSYGTCCICAGEIGRERLEAVPDATKCIKCKSEEERAQRSWARLPWYALSPSVDKAVALSFLETSLDEEISSDEEEEPSFEFPKEAEMEGN